MGSGSKRVGTTNLRATETACPKKHRDAAISSMEGLTVGKISQLQLLDSVYNKTLLRLSLSVQAVPFD